MPIFRGKQVTSANSDYKDSARAALRSNLNLASSVTVIDGVSLSNEDRVLLAGQTSAIENGIYSWSSATNKLSRAIDADSSQEISPGMRVYVEEGTLHSKSIWVVISTGQINIGSSAIVFAKDGVVNTTNLAGTYGSSTKSAIITVEESGEITSVTEAAIDTYGAGTGIIISNNNISISSTVVTTAGVQTLDNKVIDGGDF